MEDSNVKSLGSVARAGALWQMTAQITEIGLGFGVLIYLAHVVDASTFGIVSFAIAITIVVSTVVSSPVTRAVIAHGYASQSALSTAWWAATLPSALTSIVIVGVVAAVGFRGRELIAVSVVAASMTLVSCSTLIQAILQQRLEFRAVATGRIVAAVSSSAVAVSLGASGSGFAGLLSRSVTGPLLIIFIGMLQARWRPRFIVDRSTLRTIGAYTWGIAGFNLLNQLNRYGDNLLVGSFLGSAALGYYALAYRFVATPVGQVGSVAQSVVFPTLARVEDPRRFREALLRSQKMLVWMIGPLGICSMAVGDVGIRVVFGQQWIPAGTIVQVFGAVALLQIASNQVGVIYYARNATRLLMLWALISTPIIVGSFAIGILGGVKGVAWAYLAANIVLFYPSWQIPGRLIGLTGGTVLRNLKVELGFAFGLAGGMIGLRAAVAVDSLATVMVCCVALTVIYWIGSALADAGLRKDVMQLITFRRTTDRSVPDLSIN